MYIRIALFVALLTLPLAANSSPKAGWSGNVKGEMVAGCVESLTENVVAGAKQQSGIAASDPLPAEMQKVLDSQFVPEFKKACVCTVDNIALQHDYKDLESDPGNLMRAAALVGSPKGCPLNL